MAATGEVNSPAEVSPDFKAVCRIEATVVTGLEHIAKAECFEKLGAEPETMRGRIFFDMPIDSVDDVSVKRGYLFKCRTSKTKPVSQILTLV